MKYEWLTPERRSYRAALAPGERPHLGTRQTDAASSHVENRSSLARSLLVSQPALYRRLTLCLGLGGKPQKIA